MIRLEKTVAYTVEEAAEILHQSLATVRGYIHSGEVKAKKIGRRYYITDSELEKFVSGESETTEKR